VHIYILVTYLHWPLAGAVNRLAWPIKKYSTGRRTFFNLTKSDRVSSSSDCSTLLKNGLPIPNLVWMRWDEADDWCVVWWLDWQWIEEMTHHVGSCCPRVSEREICCLYGGRPRRKRETESEENVSHGDESTEPEMITSVGVRLAFPP
jgi:hypothetical protein